MTMIEQTMWLFAQRSRWERLGDGLGGKSAQLSATELGYLAAAVVLGILGVWWLHRMASRRDGTLPYESPRGVFRGLCRAHGLDRRQRGLLKDMVAYYGLADPAVLFVDPRYYSAAQLPAAIREESTEITRLGELLFAELEDSPEHF